jgi:5-methylcytosine-specific restriction endonuclease McrA
MTQWQCCRCGEIDEGEAYSLKNPWCKACYREWHRSRYTPSTGANDDPRPCRNCGVVYAPKARRPSVFCSRECKNEDRKALLKAQREASKPDRSCLWCSANMPKAMRSDARFCSEQCNSAAHAVTRKAAQRSGLKNRNGDLISLAYIAERDKWRCGICGERVGKGRRHPDPLAGSIDHIVPISCGGESADPANLQLAHFVCNWRKQARPTGEQLRLLG